MTLNIAFVTSRKNPCFEWFADSLKRETGGNLNGIRIIVVDYWKQAIPHANWTLADVNIRAKSFKSFLPFHVPPKPTPHQGPHRLTRNDYFAPANARNTAICYALDGWIAFVDDLSVLMPGWLSAVREAIKENRITCGAFRKVKNLVVENGNVISYDDHPSGVDSRWASGDDTKPIRAYPNWLFGCSFLCPVELLLQINGLPELCDSTGLGLEDCSTGIALSNNGHQLWYDRRMLTFESEERHHMEKPMLRMDKKGAGKVPVGDHPDEKGFAIVHAFKNAVRFKNYFEEGGIRALRQKILAGQPFPNIVEPKHDFYDGQCLYEL